jgi:ABC-type multidrug transport system fused ATPase/permease subunit
MRLKQTLLSLQLLVRLGRHAVDFPHWILGVLASVLGGALWTLEPWVGKALIDVGLRGREREAFVALLVVGGSVAALAFSFELASRWLLGELERRTAVRFHLLEAGIELEARSSLQVPSHPSSGTPGAVGEGTSLGPAVRTLSELLCLWPARVLSSAVQLLLVAVVLGSFLPWLGITVLTAWGALFLLTDQGSSHFAGAKEKADHAGRRFEGSRKRLGLLRSWLRLGRRSDQGLRVLRMSLERWRETSGTREAWESFLLTLQWGGSLSIQLGVALFCGFQVVAGTLSVGEYIAIQIYLSLARGPVEKLAEAWKGWASAQEGLRPLLGGDARAERWIFELASVEKVVAPEIAEESRSRSLRLQSTRFWDGEIVLEDVSVGPMEGVSIRIPRGSRVLVPAPAELDSRERAHFFQDLRDLLSGAVHPRKGVIRVGGRDLREMPHAWVRRWSGIFHAEPCVFGGTLRELLLHDFLPSRSEPEVEAWIQRLSLEHFSAREWIEPEEFSLEEIQRIELGRVLLQRPGLLILEEGLPLWSLGDPHRWTTLLKGEARTLLAFGDAPGVLPLVDSVWVPASADATPVPLERFLLEGDLGVIADSRSILSLAVESRTLQGQWQAIQERFKLKSVAFEVTLSGETEAMALLLPRMIEGCREAFREADLATRAGTRTFRILCLGAPETERPLLRSRLQQTLARVVLEAQRRGWGFVSFLVQDWAPPGSETPRHSSAWVTQLLRSADPRSRDEPGPRSVGQEEAS